MKNGKTYLISALVLLTKPTHGGKRHNLISLLKNRISNFPNLENTRSEKESKVPRKTGDSEKLLNKAIISQIEEGNFKSALRLISSDEKLASFSNETAEELIKKHPMCPSDRKLCIPLKCTPQLFVSESIILKTIQSFPPGSSGGPDGLTPQHIKDLINCKESPVKLLTNITSFCNMLLAGKCHFAVVPFFFGGRLVALNKKDGGIRPIAIGYYWRRLASKCANNYSINKMKSYFFPRQVGVGVAGGCEAAVHATRRLLQNLPKSHILVKLDFKNAFNTVRRDHLLNQISIHIPELEQYCFQSYANTSYLKFGEFIINSEEGIQQGDPLGPFLFCLSIQPILNSLESKFNIAYLDDISLCSDIETVIKDMKIIDHECKEIGLNLNSSKSEVISLSPISNVYFSNFNHTPMSKATLLGAALSSNDAMTEIINKHCYSFKLAMQRLQLLPSHYAFIILKSALSTPKLLYTLRASPCLNHPGLIEFDNLLKYGLSLITNNNINEFSWLQASLPIHEGGLGIRSVVSLAPSAFIASAASTYLVQCFLLENLTIPEDPLVKSYREFWQKSNNSEIPISTHSQKAWDEGSIKTILQTINNNLSDIKDKSRFLAVRAPHSSDWLNALPLPSCGLFLDNETFRVAVGLRLGLNICLKHRCPCGYVIDEKGTHCLSCKKIYGRVPRHQSINDIIWRSLLLADIPSSKEPQGLSIFDSKRPDGVTLIPWKLGKCLTWDVTIADTFAPTYLNSTSVKAGSAAEILATKKNNKYNHLTSTFFFQPIALESMGPISSCTLEFFEQLCSRITLNTADHNSKSFFFQRISITIQRFNYVCFKSSFDTMYEERAEIMPIDEEGGQRSDVNNNNNATKSEDVLLKRKPNIKSNKINTLQPQVSNNEPITSQQASKEISIISDYSKNDNDKDKDRSRNNLERRNNDFIYNEPVTRKNSYFVESGKEMIFIGPTKKQKNISERNNQSRNTEIESSNPPKDQTSAKRNNEVNPISRRDNYMQLSDENDNDSNEDNFNSNKYKHMYI